jgi:SNF2 family DNA or RNA helicase
MDLAGADVVVMSYQIFKKDFIRVTSEFRHKPIFIICDEAAAIRNIRTQTYKAVRDLCRMPNKMFTLLSGTPVGNPVHGYAYISLINPTIYRDFRQFITIHVTSVDIFKQPNGFAHLDLLKENLMRQAVRIRADDVLQLPPIQFVPVEYDLDPKHKRLYDRLVEEKLLVLEDEEVLDGTVAQRLYHSCQRLILKAANGEKPQAFSLIDLMLDELDIPLSGEKLIVFCNYQDSNKEIYSHLRQISGIGAVQAYGGLSPAASRRNLQQFLEDPAIHVLVGNPKTVGEGVDNCQSVSRAILFLELPLTGNVFQQCIARVYREGQKKHCVIKMAIANGTIQQKLQKSIISKEDVIQKVMPTKQTLRAALYGT